MVLIKKVKEWDDPLGDCIGYGLAVVVIGFLVLGILTANGTFGPTIWSM